MTTKSRYLLKTHPDFDREDMPSLPQELREDFSKIYKPLLMTDPYNCQGYPTYGKRGDLAGYRALEIDYGEIAYRLVYRIYDASAPKWVKIISFDEHDPAYEKAKIRTSRK
ncbi:MAG: hypothetical protein RLZZ338_2203 [Cyanobacteriota bacterium]